MYSVVDYQKTDLTLQFTFVAPGIDDEEWHHIAVAEPLIQWFNSCESLVARELNANISPDQILDHVVKLAAKNRVPLHGIDWLGLALLAEQRYKESAEKLADDESLECQDECSRRYVLARTLGLASEQIATAIQLHAT